MANDGRERLIVVLARTAISATVILGLCLQAAGHEGDRRRPVVVDADLGLDDAVALAMALQNPDLELVALVASAGVADAETATRQLGQLATCFNREEIPRFAATSTNTSEAPPWRERARAALDAAMSAGPPITAQPASAAAYTVDGAPTTVLVIGPLTGLAGSLARAPDTAAGVERVVVAGNPESADDWNLGRDPEALDIIRTAGVSVVFVRPGVTGGKPASWYAERLRGGQGTALGETLLDRLLQHSDTRSHYLGRDFHDELAMLYLVRPELFIEVSSGIFEPADAAGAATAIGEALSRGRQHKDRVVFVDGSLPGAALRPDVRGRRDAILADNGPDEWFAQLLLNELHEHLGAYSIIGVKMGLRAAELLNAPQHSMQISSATPAQPPVSCLNDGLLVSTGSTPGRGLFRHDPGPPGTVEATFSYNGRSLTLVLKTEYRSRIRTAIQALLAHSTLEDDAYWVGVRELGLEIWQSWHRRDLFEVVGSTEQTCGLTTGSKGRVR